MPDQWPVPISANAAPTSTAPLGSQLNGVVSIIGSQMSMADWRLALIGFHWHKRRRACRPWRQDTLFSMNSWEPIIQNAPKRDTGRYRSPVAADDDCLMRTCIVCPIESKAKDVLPRGRGSGRYGRQSPPIHESRSHGRGIPGPLPKKTKKYSALCKRRLRRTGTMYLELPCAPLHPQLRHTPSISAIQSTQFCLIVFSLDIQEPSLLSNSSSTL